MHSQEKETLSPSAVVLIPARYQSSRFPGKPLALISQKSMIQRVYENMRSENWQSFVVTDDKRIEQHLLDLKARVIRVDDEVISGSERIALAQERYLQDVDYIINVQGDEPLLSSDVILELLRAHQESSFDIMTLVRPCEEDEIQNPNTVKAIYNEKNNECRYFTRSPISYAYAHIGVYCYKAQALRRFVALEPSSWEILERLEQLRALQNSMSIGAIVTHQKLIGVDSPEDIAKVEKALKKRGE